MLNSALAGAAIAGTLCRDDKGGDNPEGGMGNMIRRFEGERTELLDFIERTVSGAESGQRDLTDAEKETLATTRERVSKIDGQLKQLRDFAELRAAHREGGSHYRPTEPAENPARGRGLGAQVKDREHEYESRGQVVVDRIMADPQVSDLFTAQQRDAASERLRGARLPYKGAPDEYLAEIRAAAPHQTTEETPGLLPKPIVGQIDNDLDASRPFISSVGVKPLAGIPGKSFDRPYITQHTQSGKQTAEKTQLPSRQFKVEAATFDKESHGGWLNVSRQEIDWTSPAAWDALLADLQDSYAVDSEDTTAAKFAAMVDSDGNDVEGDLSTVPGIIEALYKAAAEGYGRVRRLPTATWISLDMWSVVGAAIDTLKATTNGNGGGDSTVNQFTGNLLSLPRIVVPSFPDGTVIVGVKDKFEYYEQRIGLLSAVEPSVLGVQIAYGGYFTSGTVRPTAFTKITATV